MVIDKIGGIGKMYEPGNSNRVNRPVEQNVALGKDTVKISEEALKAQDTAQVMKFVKSSGDIREEKVREVKEKLARGDYDTPSGEMLDRVADKIAAALMGPGRS